VFARVTLVEIDTLRIDMESAVQLFEGEVLPEVRRQPGYAGVLVLTTSQGSAALVSLWHSAEAAEASASTGFYAEMLERYMTVFASPPGRERYVVALSELPASTRS
jgi:hypothetical protein